jgi:hypothetical protein
MNALYQDEQKKSPGTNFQLNELMAQITAQAARGGGAADNQDVVEKVIDKLSVLTNIFEFFEYTNGMTDFRKRTLPGLFYIIDDCINELEGIRSN